MDAGGRSYEKKDEGMMSDRDSQTTTRLTSPQGILPTRVTQTWSEPQRGYESGPCLYKVTAASSSAVIQIYGSTQDIADQRWNEFMEDVRNA